MATYNNVITNVSGSVGIGTTNVTSRLTLLGSTTNLSEPILTVRPGSAQATATAVFEAQDSSGNSIMHVSGSGVVRVGAWPLGSSTISTLNIYGSSNNNTGVSVGDVGGNRAFFVASWGTNGLPSIGTVSNSAFSIFTNVTERLRIDTSGNVGIGTTNPGSTRLHVYETSSAGPVNITSIDSGASLPTRAMMVLNSVYNNGANGQQTYFNTTSELGPWEFNITKNWGGIVTLGSSADGTSRTRSLTINDSGRVGVGTTSLSAQFHVLGSTTTSTPTMLVRERQAMANATATLDVQNSSGTSLLFVSGSGRVGIGIVPDSRLQVVDSSGASLRIGYLGTSVNYYDANSHIHRLSDGTSRLTIDNSTIVNRNGATVLSSIDNNGYLTLPVTGSRIGIGITPTATLHITGSTIGNVPSVLVRHGVANGSDLPVFNVQNSAGTSLLFVSGSGNVGIGTTITSAKLEIYPGSIAGSATQEILRLDVPGSTILSTATGYINFRGWDVSNNTQRDVAYVGAQLVVDGSNTPRMAVSYTHLTLPTKA